MACVNALSGLSCYAMTPIVKYAPFMFQCPLGLELLRGHTAQIASPGRVSMPSWAWVVTIFVVVWCYFSKFQCPHGLELLLSDYLHHLIFDWVSMPSWAWVVTARMSNILNFSWYFLCIPAIYRCILAHLPIFFNQLSKFLRCESPSTFLGTCLSHHSFIIFLVTNTNTLLPGLYLISTNAVARIKTIISAVSVNALSGLYLISTFKKR